MNLSCVRPLNCNPDLGVAFICTRGLSYDPEIRANLLWPLLPPFPILSLSDEFCGWGCLSASRCLVFPDQATDLHPLQTFHQDDKQEIELGAATVFPKLSKTVQLSPLISGPERSGFLLHLWGKLDSWVWGKLGPQQLLMPFGNLPGERRWHTPTIVCFCLTAAGEEEPASVS